MNQDVTVLFNKDLVAAVIHLISTAKHKLLLISPTIVLDGRVVNALLAKKDSHHFELRVLLGKSNDETTLSERDSIEFLKQFPDVEIRQHERLRANFFQNDYEYIMGSLQLYNYAQADNIEAGVRYEYAAKGILGKALNVTSDVIGQGVEKVKQDVIGMEKSISPMEQFKMLFESAALKYKTRPLIGEKGGLRGLMGAKKLDGFEIVLDDLLYVEKPIADEPKGIEAVAMESSNQNIQPDYSGESHEPVQVNPTTPVMDNCVSAEHLAAVLGVQSRDILNLMQRKGYIENNNITDRGYAKGLVMKRFMDKDYIAFPAGLEEWNEFRLG